MIETRLAEIAPSPDLTPMTLKAAWAHAVLAPAKRIRPLLVMAATADLGVDDLTDALDAGCALELVHTASLILDDLPCMDDAQLRRGRPTLHRMFGESTAILTAVALLNQAHQHCTQLAGRELGETLAKAIGFEGLVGGQFRDLYPDAASVPAIEQTYTQKTGALFTAGCDMAAQLGSADVATAAALHAFAAEVGVAFQLADDLIDTTATSSSAGKDVGKDGAIATLQRSTSVSFATDYRDQCIMRAGANLALLSRADALSQWLIATLG